MAIANKLQLEAARRHAIFRLNYDRRCHAKVEVADSEHIHHKKTIYILKSDALFVCSVSEGRTAGTASDYIDNHVTLPSDG